MKKKLLGIVLVATLVYASIHRTYADTPAIWTKIEIPLQAFLTPETGFEEKNNIQAVLYGFLPNACYTLGEYTTEKQSDGRSILVRQYAIRDNSGVCAEDSSMPNHMKMMVPFTTEISIGSLKAGNYQFIYNKAGDGERTRGVSISKNVSPGVDTLPYAAVSAAESPDVVNGRDHVKVTLTGVLNSTCTELNENVKVLYEKDVFVLLPTIKVKTGVMCAEMLVPFAKEIDLGTTIPGIHLIHARSMNGKSVNKVIMVAR